MADNIVKGSIDIQIKAIEGWALNAYQESVKKNPNTEEIIENLRKINLQARRVFGGIVKELKRQIDITNKEFEEATKRVEQAITQKQKTKGYIDVEHNSHDWDQLVYKKSEQISLAKRRYYPLREKITQLRAAVVTLRDIKKDQGLSNNSKKILRSLSATATEVVKMVDNFLNPK